MVAPKAGNDVSHEKNAGFAAALALYPGCGFQYGDWRPVRKSGPGGPDYCLYGSL
jgi:hypothetical protein